MKDFWHNLHHMKRRLKRARTTCLFLDFDGTLAPIAPAPEQAILADSTRALLVRLSKRSDMALAVVSGRPLADIKMRVGVDGIVYAGDHGFTWETGGRTAKKAVPAHTRVLLSRAAQISKRVAASYPGVRVEEKYASVAVHYRAVRAGKQQEFLHILNRALAPIISTGSVIRFPGKKVVEVRPALQWGKGEVVTLLARFFCKGRPGPYAGVAIGDDRTDEDIFAAHPEWITICVGHKRKSSASYFVNSTRDVTRALAWIADREQDTVQTVAIGKRIYYNR